MSLTTTCKGCGIELEGVDEDDLVIQVQRHLDEVHPGHRPTRDQIRDVIRKRADREHQPEQD